MLLHRLSPIKKSDLVVKDLDSKVEVEEDGNFHCKKGLIMKVVG